MTPITDIRHTEIVECAGIALVNGGRIFLVRPSYGNSPQSLAIPKGHVEIGETARKCALREFLEETGIALKASPDELEFLTYAKTRIGRNGVKKVSVYVVRGSGSEKFRGSARFDDGTPENIYGEYVDYDSAEELITPYQKCIIEELKRREMSSFESFCSYRMGI